jgi:hypothetical protein
MPAPQPAASAPTAGVPPSRPSFSPGDEGVLNALRKHRDAMNHAPLKYPGYMPGEGQIHAEYNQKIDDHIRSLGFKPGMRPQNGGAPYDVEDAARRKFKGERAAAINKYKTSNPLQYARDIGLQEAQVGETPKRNWNLQSQLVNRPASSWGAKASEKGKRINNAVNGVANGVDRGIGKVGKFYDHLPKALQYAHAVINPLTGVPMLAAANWDKVKGAGRKVVGGIKKFGRGIKNFGGRVIGGIANAFKWRK